MVTNTVDGTILIPEWAQGLWTEAQYLRLTGRSSIPEWAQGLGTEAQYLRLTDQGNRLIEFTDGTLEVLPMPTDKHQAISQLLLFALAAFIHLHAVEKCTRPVLRSPLQRHLRLL